MALKLPTVDEIKAYRIKHETSLQEAKAVLTGRALRQALIHAPVDPFTLAQILQTLIDRLYPQDPENP